MYNSETKCKVWTLLNNDVSVLVNCWTLLNNECTTLQGDDGRGFVFWGTVCGGRKCGNDSATTWLGIYPNDMKAYVYTKTCT